MIVTVCAAGCMYASLANAARRVPKNSTIIVRGNARGGVTLDWPLIIRGEGGATITGGGSGIIVRAARARIEGLRFTGYGLDDPSGQHAAIVVAAPAVVVRRNRFDGNAFAVTLSRADRAVISHNLIAGVAAAQPDVAGDSLRLWYSNGVIVTGNTFSNGRDILISYSQQLLFANNAVRTSRYGLHDMFSDFMRVQNNVFENNEIGANFMYAKGLEIGGNTFEANHGASGYGVGWEDVDSSRLSGNRFEENRVGLNSVDSPSDPSNPDEVQGNVFTHNGSAFGVQSDPHALRVTGNAFIDNIEDVAVSGGGSAAGVVWTIGGRGNYWSAYPGYDRNGDGVGDISYAPQPAFDSLTDTHPELQMFRYSPAALAVQFAARAIPAVEAQPKFVDSAPLIARPDVAPGVRSRRKADPLIALLALLAVVPLAAIRRTASITARAGRRRAAVPSSADLAVEAQGARKLYASERGIRNVTLSVRAGESVGLWGVNGAGKTTFFRCILGEKIDSGTLRVFGYVPSPRDLASRSFIGYAPQHLPDFDARIGEIAQTVAALRGAGSAEIDRVLDLLGLTRERGRFISELSGGMRQRLGIALALIGDPPMLLLDEPTAGLDRAGREAVIALLRKERARGKTLLFTSHLLEDVCALADRVVAMECGNASESVPAPAFAAQYVRNIS